MNICCVFSRIVRLYNAAKIEVNLRIIIATVLLRIVYLMCSAVDKYYSHKVHSGLQSEIICFAYLFDSFSKQSTKQLENPHALVFSSVFPRNELFLDGLILKFYDSGKTAEHAFHYAQFDSCGNRIVCIRCHSRNFM